MNLVSNIHKLVIEKKISEICYLTIKVSISINIFFYNRKLISFENNSALDL